ncbi:MAG: rod-binding protein [Oligoflexia bacterium]|nr:rod-binding protein [Oligoflexia bacterium]
MSEIKDKQGAKNFISLGSEVKTPTKDKRDPKMLQAAQMFENQFLRQLISQMRKTVPESDFMPDSNVQKFYKQQMDDNYANTWTENGGIGLADLIYQQMQDKMESRRLKPPVKQNGEHMPIQPESRSSQIKPNNSQKLPATFWEDKTSDLIARADKDLFLLKKTQSGLFIKSREPLPEHVDIKAPLNAKVLQAANLGEGKQMLILEHDKGLKTQFVHTGENLVEPGQVLIAGQALARLPASRQGELASVVFGLRYQGSIE